MYPSDHLSARRPRPPAPYGLISVANSDELGRCSVYNGAQTRTPHDFPRTPPSPPMPSISPRPVLQGRPRWLRTLYNQCTPWTGTLDARGYPRAKTRSGKSYYPGRAAYEQLFGRLEPGERVFRRCGRRDCVNPLHGTTDPEEARPKRRRRRPASAKLNRRKADEIRARWAEPDRPTQQELADEYGVSRSTISLIVRGKTWQQ